MSAHIFAHVEYSMKVGDGAGGQELMLGYNTTYLFKFKRTLLWFSGLVICAMYYLGLLGALFWVIVRLNMVHPQTSITAKMTEKTSQLRCIET